MSVIINGDTGIDKITDGSIVFADFNSNVPLGTKNLIINGDMKIDQRNSGSEVTPANDAYTLDRWKYNASQASKLKVQQNAQAITGPAGFKNYLGVTVNATHTVTSSDNFMISQAIEGYNSAHLEFGTANAKTITVSFWVQSSLTGTFSGSLQNSAEDRSYPFEYTISSASTWEYKTITITGDTSGTWIGATNGKGLKIWFSLGMGSNFTGTANQWNGAQDFASSGETVKLVENSAAEWKITGVQLEVGNTATPFEHRPYDMELARCHRYYWQQTTAVQASKYSAFSGVQTSTVVRNMLILPATMRTAPTVTGSGYSQVGMGAVPTAVSSSVFSESSCSLAHSGSGFTTGNVGVVNFDVTVDAEL